MDKLALDLKIYGKNKFGERLRKIRIETDWAKEIELERENWYDVRKLLRELAVLCAAQSGNIWRWGDGYGGALLGELYREIGAVGLQVSPIRDPSRPRRATISVALRNTVIARDGLTCQYCGAKLEAKNATLDHVKPVALGGETTAANLVVACGSCNSSKGTRCLPKQKKTDATRT